jgi:hypothetical protein
VLYVLLLGGTLLDVLFHGTSWWAGAPRARM